MCESMRFDSGPEVFACENRSYVLTEHVLNENDCVALFFHDIIAIDDIVAFRGQRLDFARHNPSANIAQ